MVVVVLILLTGRVHGRWKRTGQLMRLLYRLQHRVQLVWIETTVQRVLDQATDLLTVSLLKHGHMDII